MIVVGYVDGMLAELTRAWAEAHDARMVRLSADTDYHDLLAGMWTGAEDLIVVEQGVDPAPGVVSTMAACRRPWCASPYWVGHSWLADGLGCTRIAARVQVRHPDLWATFEVDDGLPARDWRRVDTRLSAALRRRGYRPHVHARSRHLHDYRCA